MRFLLLLALVVAGEARVADLGLYGHNHYNRQFPRANERSVSVNCAILRNCQCVMKADNTGKSVWQLECGSCRPFQFQNDTDCVGQEKECPYGLYKNKCGIPDCYRGPHQLCVVNTLDTGYDWVCEPGSTCHGPGLGTCSDINDAKRMDPTLDRLRSIVKRILMSDTDDNISGDGL